MSCQIFEQLLSGVGPLRKKSNKRIPATSPAERLHLDRYLATGDF